VTLFAPRVDDAVEDPGHQLTFTEPAGNWLEALPLGNGRLGAMVFGGVTREHLQLNDGTAWSGDLDSEFAHGQVRAEVAAEAIAQARAAIAAGDHPLATRSVQRLQERYTQAFLPFADAVLVTAHGDATVSAYVRRLDLREAEHTVTYRVGGATVTRRTVISHPDGLLLTTIDLSGGSGGGLDLDVSLETPLQELGRGAADRETWLTVRLPSEVAPPHEHDIPSPVYDGRPAVQGAVVLRWDHDGEEVAGGPGSLRARGVGHLTLVITTETTFVGIGQPARGEAADALVGARATAAAGIARGAVELRERQRRDHRTLYERVELAVPSADERMNRIRLLFHYDRYLVISSSRAGGLPATLQGLWNDSLRPPWSSNYTININLQMNYWAADVAALPECLPPLFDLIAALRRQGEDTARRVYGARGWCAHHNTDAWAFTSPVGLGKADPAWALWPFAGVWLATQLLDHAEFVDDADFARWSWPIVRSAALFVLDRAMEHDDGSLGFSPSTSPENHFAVDGGVFSVAESSTIDIALARDLLTRLPAAAARAGVDDPMIANARHAASRLSVPPIAGDGTAQEWRAPLAPADPGHRHLSPLWSVYPGHDDSPAFAAAARRTLDERGDDSTGWSLAWKLALRARLGDKSRIPGLIDLALRDALAESTGERGGLYPNRFSAHPPFQIDGNLGFSAALAECLLQSHAGRIRLLPALPTAWPAGSIRGLVARPGVIVDITWDDEGMVRSARLRAAGRAQDGIVVESAAWTLTLDLAPDRTVVIDAGGRVRAVDDGSAGPSLIMTKAT